MATSLSQPVCNDFLLGSHRPLADLKPVNPVTEPPVSGPPRHSLVAPTSTSFRAFCSYLRKV